MLIAPGIRHRVIKCRVTIDGTQYTATGIPSRSIGLDQPRSSCAAQLTEMPSELAKGKPASIDIAINGKWQRFFTGYADPDTSDTSSKSVNLVDCLYKLERSPKEACGETDGIYFENISFVDAVRLLLNKAGIPDEEIESIYDPGSVYDIGTVEPFCMEPTENIRPWVDDLMKFGGATIWVKPMSGKVVVSNRNTIPAPGGNVIFAAGNPYAISNPHATPGGVDSSHYRMDSMSRQTTPFEGVVIKYTASGPLITDGMAPEMTWEASEETVNALPEEVGKSAGDTYKFAQTMDQVTAIATREGEQLCGYVHSFSLSARLDPDMLPGRSIQFKNHYIEYPELTAAYVRRVAANGDTMTLDLRVGEALEGEPDLCDPYVDLSVSIDAERVNVSGAYVKRYFVYCEAKAEATVGAIASTEWTVAGATSVEPTPSTVTSLTPMFVVDEVTGVTITFSATDNQDPAQTAEVTVALDAPNIQIMTRIISVALGADGWLLFISADKPPRQWAGDTIIGVPSFNDSGPLLALSPTKLYKTIDYLANDPTVLFDFGTACTSGVVFVNEGNKDDVLVARDSVLWRSMDGGETFIQVYTFASTINDCQSAIGTNATLLYVSSGESLWETGDNGATWQPVLTETGCVAADIASAPWGHLVAFTGGSVPVAFSEEHAITGLSITEATANSPYLAIEGNVIADSTGALYSLRKQPDETFAATSCAENRTAEVKWLLRDGVYPLIYGTGADGTFKQVIDTETLYTLDTQIGYRLGYGAMVSKIPGIVAAGVIWLPAWAIASGGDIRPVWMYRNGVWTSNSTAQPDTGSYNFHWHTVSVDTADPQKILAVGCSNQHHDFEFGFTSDGDYIRAVSGIESSPFRYSDDGGDTWYDIRIHQPAGLGWNKTRIGKQGDRAFLVDGKLYTILSYDGSPRYYYVLYGGEIQWAGGYYEVDSSYWYGNFDLGADQFNLIAAFAYHKKDANGYPIIPWISRYGNRVGYITYDPATDTVDPHMRTESDTSGGRYWKKISTVLSTNEMVFTGEGYMQKYFADYESGAPTNVSIAAPNIYNYTIKHAIDKNGVLYTVENTNSTPNRLEPPYDSRTEIDELDNEEQWLTVARNEQESARGRFIAIGNDEGTMALYDAETDTWMVVDYDAGMTGMSNTAFAVFAEEV